MQRHRKQKNSGEAVGKGVRVILRISLIFIDDVIISVIIDYHCTSHIVKRAFFTLHTPHATKGRCLMIFIVFGSTHISRRGYNNNEYYYDRRKSAAAMAYLAAAAPTPLTWKNIADRPQCTWAIVSACHRVVCDWNKTMAKVKVNR